MATSKVNPDLLRERNRASFETNKLTHVLDGGDYFTERRRQIERMVFEDKGYDGPNYHFMSRDEIYNEGMRKNMYMVKRTKELGLTEPADLYYYRVAASPNENIPSSLNSAMFIPALQGQASDEQQAKWLDKARQYEIIGTYAQTEMGHGTFLRGLETIATYDEKTEEFILHSPTLTSIKWWPGGLGKTSSHAIVMANMIIKGKSLGMHAFMLQLRDMETHQPLPGIELGDIGPKFGYSMIDNGYLKLNHVRIPRTNMLMKNSQVLPDGTYMKAKHSKLSYGTMVFVRAMIVWDVAAKGLGQACTIAIRYSCVRRQSELKPGGPEPQVLDFQSQQLKLFSQLANAYAFTFAGMMLRNTYFMVNSDIQAGNIQALPELHGLSSGLKAYTTTEASNGIEVCRMSCGGHGYSQASGIPKIYVNAVPACTYEGENSVLLLQTARYLIKNYTQARQGRKLEGWTSYLSEKSFDKCLIASDFKLESFLHAFKYRAARLVNKAADQLSKHESMGKPQHEAWNSCSVFLIQAAQAHAEFCILKTFVDRICEGDIEEASIIRILTALCQLWAINALTKNSGEFLVDGFMTSDQLVACEEKIGDLLTQIRPEAVALVDAFDFHDRILCSELGRYDGNVYENLFKWAKASPLNKKEVHESFHKYVKPLREQSKL